MGKVLTKINKKRAKTVTAEPTIEGIAKEFGLSIDEVKHCIRAYASLQSPEIQAICNKQL